MMTRLLLLVLLTFAAVAASAQAPEPTVPAAARAVPLDPVAATRAWIDTLPAAQRAKTDAYFEGGHWIALWGAAVGVASAWLLLASDPDAEAAAILKLGEYRKMEPGPFEEFIFYTHPSGWRRIENAMRWKAEQQRAGAR